MYEQCVPETGHRCYNYTTNRLKGGKMMQLSNNIRAFRKKRSLTQEQLAQALGVTAGAVYKWEAALSTPDISLILALADFFDTSVDVLLGYEVRDNKREAALKRLKELAFRRDDCGLAEAEQLLVRYPNCFDIVYYSADLYWTFGFIRRDQALLRRCIELMERACLLIGQNTDPEISELAIRHSIAKAWSALGEGEKAAALFMRDNPRGIHNDFIGYILGTACGRTEEAVPYLSRALLRCVSSLDRIVIGYFNVYFRRGDFSAAADIVRLALCFFSDLKKPGQNNYLDKASAGLYVSLAAAQVELADTDEARESLRQAKALAEQFDLAPDYSGERLRFISLNRPSSALDDMGATAMECVQNALEECRSETLTALWREVVVEEPQA